MGTILYKYLGGCTGPSCEIVFFVWGVLCVYKENSFGEINFIKNYNQPRKTAIISNDYKIYCLLIAYFNFFYI